MVYVGPGDFSVEMGRPGEPDHPISGVRWRKTSISASFTECHLERLPSTQNLPGLVMKVASFFEAYDELTYL
jgi:hypothetical protein